MNQSLPSKRLLQLQADWLAEARSRMLRLAEIATRKRVLDLGSGYGMITNELQRRTDGIVIALDHAIETLRDVSVLGDAQHLPFRSNSFDLAFSQNVLMWIDDPQQAAHEAFRVLSSKGVWVLFEPDYGGMIEYPVETRQIWIDALTRSGADPLIGRRLPSILRSEGFRFRVELLPRLLPAANERYDFLLELPLTDQEKSEIMRFKQATEPQTISHLPYFLVIADKP